MPGFIRQAAWLSSLPWCVASAYCDFNSTKRAGCRSQHVGALLLTCAAARSRAGRSETSLRRRHANLFSAAIARLLEGARPSSIAAMRNHSRLIPRRGRRAAWRSATPASTLVDRRPELRNDKLLALGRVHDAGQAEAAVATARAAGFTNLNLDLMYGLPGDDVVGAVADLERAIALKPEHLSWYQLTLEPNTAFERRPPALPDDDVVARIEEQGRALLAAHGYERYEVSAYARRGRRSQHNLNYWHFGDYLGIGAGAHGKVTLHALGEIARRAKTRNPRTYVEQAGSATVTSEERGLTQRQATRVLDERVARAEGAVEMFKARASQPQRGSARRAAAIARGWLCRRFNSAPRRPGSRELNKLLELFA
jgi:oxygen-independent coproporphyrinogen-3 oxidase